LWAPQLHGPRPRACPSLTLIFLDGFETQSSAKSSFYQSIKNFDANFTARFHSDRIEMAGLQPTTNDFAAAAGSSNTSLGASVNAIPMHKIPPILHFMLTRESVRKRGGPILRVSPYGHAVLQRWRKMHATFTVPADAWYYGPNGEHVPFESAGKKFFIHHFLWRAENLFPGDPCRCSGLPPFCPQPRSIHRINGK
jgi:hypothetical protein